MRLIGKGNFWWRIVGSGSGSGPLEWMNEIKNFGWMKMSTLDE